MDYYEKDRPISYLANFLILKTLLSVFIIFLAFYIYSRRKKQPNNKHRLSFAVLQAISEKNFDSFKKALETKLEANPKDFNCMPGGNYFFHLVSICDLKDDANLFINLEESLAENANFYTKALDYLIERNCDIDLKDNQGRTALFAACWWRCEYMIHLFLSRGADPNMRIAVFYDFRLMSCLMYKKYYDLACKLFTNNKIDFVAILIDIEGFRTTFRHELSDNDIEKMISFVTLFQRRKQIIHTLCAFNSTKNIKDRSCLEQIDKTDMYYFIRNYLIKDF